MIKLAHSESRKKALVIAVSEYNEDSNLKNLPFCKNDGNEMRTLLNELGYEIKHQDGLIGSVDGRLMQDCIYEFFKDDIKSDDTLLFYFSGHGVPGMSDFFLASSNIDQTKPKMRGFSFNDLTDEIQGCNAKRVVIILDSCFAGSLKTSKSEESAMAVAAKNHQSAKFKEGEGRCLLSSCMGFQESFATVEGNHSFFTNYLIEGLGGAGGKSVEDTGVVTPESLMRFIDAKIDSLPEDKRQNQTPFRKIESAGKIMLATYPQFAQTTLAPTKLDSKLIEIREKAQSYLSGREFEKAIELYDKVLEIDPTDKYSLRYKCYALYALNRHEEIIENSEKALKIDPQYKEALVYRGIGPHCLGRHEEAIEWYDKALKIDPDYNFAIVNKGFALSYLKRYVDAIALYDRVPDSDPDFKRVLEEKQKAQEALEKKRKNC